MRLTDERKKRGWSKSELSRRSGVALPEICRIEGGKIYPYPGWRRKLAAALEVSEEELFPEIEILETALDEGARRERERIRGEVEKLRELREEVKAKVEREQSIDIVYYYSGALWALEMVLKYLEDC